MENRTSISSIFKSLYRGNQNLFHIGIGVDQVPFDESTMIDDVVLLPKFSVRKTILLFSPDCVFQIPGTTTQYMRIDFRMSNTQIPYIPKEVIQVNNMTYDFNIMDLREVTWLTKDCAKSFFYNLETEKQVAFLNPDIAGTLIVTEDQSTLLTEAGLMTQLLGSTKKIFTGFPTIEILIKEKGEEVSYE